MKMKKEIQILVVEDDPIQIDWARQQLKHYYKVAVATTAREGRELADSKKFNMLLLDLNLPEEEGNKPSMEAGMRQLCHFLGNWSRYETIKGIALVSNFEHHVDYADKAKTEEEKMKQRMILQKIYGLQTLSARIEGWGTTEQKMKVNIQQGKNLANSVVIMADSLHI